MHNLCMTLHDRPLGELGYPPFELPADENVDSHRWFDGKVSLFYLLTSTTKEQKQGIADACLNLEVMHTEWAR